MRWPANTPFWTWPPSSPWVWPPPRNAPRDPQRPPLPASAVEYWHSELQCTPTAWVGQIGGRTLAGINAPSVATDGTNFNGRVVAHLAVVGSRAFFAAGLPVLALAGTKPWCYFVGRLVTAPANTNGILINLGDGTSNIVFIRWQVGVDIPRAQFSDVSVDNTGLADLAPHPASFWKDATDDPRAHFKVSNTDQSVPSAVAAATNLTQVGFGTNSVGTFNYLDARLAFVMICSSQPSAAEEAALDAWALSWWGVV